MTAILLVAIGIAVLFSIGFAFGGPVLALVLAVVAAVAAIVWFVAVGARGQTPTEEVRRTDDQELLGPGGPDDPSR